MAILVEVRTCVLPVGLRTVGTASSLSTGWQAARPKHEAEGRLSPGINAAHTSPILPYLQCGAWRCTQLILLAAAFVIGRALEKARFQWMGEAGAALLLGLFISVMLRLAQIGDVLAGAIAFKVCGEGACGLWGRTATSAVPPTECCAACLRPMHVVGMHGSAMQLAAPGSMKPHQRPSHSSFPPWAVHAASCPKRSHHTHVLPVAAPPPSPGAWASPSSHRLPPSPPTRVGQPRPPVLLLLLLHVTIHPTPPTSRRAPSSSTFSSPPSCLTRATASTPACEAPCPAAVQAPAPTQGDAFVGGGSRTQGFSRGRA